MAGLIRTPIPQHTTRPNETPSISELNRPGVHRLVTHSSKVIYGDTGIFLEEPPLFFLSPFFVEDISLQEVMLPGKSTRTSHVLLSFRFFF